MHYQKRIYSTSSCEFFYFIGFRIMSNCNLFYLKGFPFTTIFIFKKLVQNPASGTKMQIKFLRRYKRTEGMWKIEK